MKHRRLIGISLSLALVLALSTSALATDLPPGQHNNVGDSTISIMTAAVDPKNVSFTVPLYVTLAVVATDETVKVPDNYQITNTSTAGSSATNYQIGVTAMSFEKLAASTFNTVAKPDQAQALTNINDIYLTIGGLDMPALSQEGIQPVTLAAGSSFVTNSKPAAIAVGESLMLPITGKVASSAREGAATAAQFRVKYTISLLSGGDPLGLVYAGNDRVDAGLKPIEP